MAPANLGWQPQAIVDIREMSSDAVLSNLRQQSDSDDGMIETVRRIIRVVDGRLDLKALLWGTSGI